MAASNSGIWKWVVALTGTISAKGNTLAIRSMKGSSCSFSFTVSVLFTGRITGRSRGHGFVPLIILERLHHEDHHIHPAQGFRHRAVHGAVQGIAILQLEARCVHEDPLRRVISVDAHDAVTRGLRLVGGDADLLADEGVE